jgi:hypothetical protein
MDEHTQDEQNEQGTQTPEAQEPDQPQGDEPRHADLDPGEKADEVKGGRVKFIR